MTKEKGNFPPISPSLPKISLSDLTPPTTDVNFNNQRLLNAGDIQSQGVIFGRKVSGGFYSITQENFVVSTTGTYTPNVFFPTVIPASYPTATPYTILAYLRFDGNNQLINNTNYTVDVYVSLSFEYRFVTNDGSAASVAICVGYNEAGKAEEVVLRADPTSTEGFLSTFGIISMAPGSSIIPLTAMSAPGTLTAIKTNFVGFEI